MYMNDVVYTSPLLNQRCSFEDRNIRITSLLELAFAGLKTGMSVDDIDVDVRALMVILSDVGCSSEVSVGGSESLRRSSESS